MNRSIAEFRLGDIARFVSGGTPSKQAPQYWGGDTPWVSAKDLKSLHIDSSIDTLSDSGRDAASIVPTGTLLILVRGMTLFKSVPIGIATRELAINQDLKGLITKDSVSPEFLAYSLLAKESEMLQMVEAAGHGTGRLSTEALKDLLIRVPSPKEQNRIVRIITTWDTAIQKFEQLIAAKERFYEALSGQLLFGLTRLPPYEPSMPKSLHWFSMSCDWPVVEIGQVAREVSVARGDAADLPVLSCTKYDGLVDSLQYFKKQVFSHDTAKYKRVQRGQFAYATNHIEEGSIGYQDLVPEGLVSPIYTVFQADGLRVDDGYLYKLLKTEKLRQLFAASTNASVDRRGSLRWKEFSRIHIPLPPVDEQRSINEVLNTAKKELALLKSEMDALRTQKRGLMQKLLTCQWRLPVHEEAN